MAVNTNKFSVSSVTYHHVLRVSRSLRIFRVLRSFSVPFSVSPTFPVPYLRAPRSLRFLRIPFIEYFVSFLVRMFFSPYSPSLPYTPCLFLRSLRSCILLFSVTHLRVTRSLCILRNLHARFSVLPVFHVSSVSSVISRVLRILYIRRYYGSCSSQEYVEPVDSYKLTT